MEPQTLIDTLLRAATASEGGLRFVDRRETPTWFSWAELVDRAWLVAGGLQSLGLAPGERVALVFPTGVQFFEALFGTWLAGGVPVPLYPPVRLGRLREYQRRTAAMLGAADVRLVLADRRVRSVLGDPVALACPAGGCKTLEALPREVGEHVALDPEQLALVQFSSGTTSDPKPVALSHAAVMSQVVALNSFWPDSSEIRHTGVSWLPLYHDMGLIGCVFPALERASVLTLIPPEVFVARPAIWLRTVFRYRATISPAPSFAYGLCVKKIGDEDLTGVDLSSWRVALNGSEPVAPSAMREFVRRFGRWGLRPEAMTPVYGLSEAALAVTFSDIGRPFTTRSFARCALSAEGRAVEETSGRELVSVGRPLPDFELAIRDGRGRSVGAGRVGRIWVRGPSLMAGYFGQPKATAKALRDGWLDTGDMGFLYQEELYLTGREKDVIIVHGRNHAPEEIEQPVHLHPTVRTGCVAAVSHLPDGGEREQVLLFVEYAKDAATADRKRIEEGCRRCVLAETGIRIDKVMVLAPGTLPRTSSGKIRRRETLRRHLDGGQEPPARSASLDLARAWGRSLLASSGLRSER